MYQIKLSAPVPFHFLRSKVLHQIKSWEFDLCGIIFQEKKLFQVSMGLLAQLTIDL